MIKINKIKNGMNRFATSSLSQVASLSQGTSLSQASIKSVGSNFVIRIDVPNYYTINVDTRKKCTDEQILNLSSKTWIKQYIYQVEVSPETKNSYIIIYIKSKYTQKLNRIRKEFPKSTCHITDKTNLIKMKETWNKGKNIIAGPWHSAIDIKVKVKKPTSKKVKEVSTDKGTDKGTDKDR